MPRAEEARDLGAGLWQVAFGVAAYDLEVRDGTVEVYFVAASDGGFVVRELFSRHAVPRLGILGDGGLLDEDAALARLTGDPSRYEMRSGRSLIFPLETKLDQFSYQVAREVSLFDRETGENLTLTLGASGGGELLEAFSDRSTAAEVEVFARNYLEPPSPWPLAFAKVMDPGGVIALDALGATAQTLEGPKTISLDSPRVRIGANQAYTFTTAFAEGDAEAAVSGNDLFATNAYVAVQRINGFVRHHLGEADAPILKRPVAVSINVQGSCNAFYTNTSISLYRAGSGCANMATVNDVIYHEWGHGFDDYTGTAGGITDGAFSEGIGDILASYMIGDEKMAVGFMTNSKEGIRRLKNVLRFPDDRGEVHDEGQIIGGAFWDLREALVKRYGAVKGAFLAERLFLKHLLTTDSYRDSYAAVLRLDDDDGNPATPSPNRCLITAAFAGHGLASLIPNCEDDPTKFGYEANVDLALGILKRGEGGVKLMGSAPSEARSLAICMGGASACADLEASGWKVMKLDGVVGDHVAFVTVEALALPENGEVWLAAYDGEARLIGRRALKIVGR